MSLIGWLNGITNIAITLIPLFLTWACAVLWFKFRSAWALAALFGATIAAVGTVVRWVAFFVHYSSTEVMLAQDSDPMFEVFQLTLAASLSAGTLVASLALVGYARSSFSAAQQTVQGDGPAFRWPAP